MGSTDQEMLELKHRPSEAGEDRNRAMGDLDATATIGCSISLPKPMRIATR